MIRLLLKVYTDTLMILPGTRTREVWIWKPQKLCCSYFLENIGVFLVSLVRSSTTQSTKLSIKISGVIFLNSPGLLMSIWPTTMWTVHGQ
uniref:Putative secreted protein n=1 Tax=Panstrongylus lignarius TaxID=156445 RepID=A0A224Y2C2_9HEMI